MPQYYLVLSYFLKDTSMNNDKKMSFAFPFFVCITIIFSQCRANKIPETNAQVPNTVTAPTDWFTVKEIAQKVWRIDDHGGDNMYLVEGDQKALLIDTGTGVADLTTLIKSITNLPVIVVNTHGHPDHVGGNFQFTEVYAQPQDNELIVRFSSEVNHQNSVQSTLAKNPEFKSVLLEKIDPYKLPQLLPVKAGDLFDLGNRTIEVIEVPGHTRGSICLLDAAHKLLFAGDNNNSLVWLFLDGCLPLESYMNTLQALQQRDKDFEIILPGHGDPLDSAFLGEQIICAQHILTGSCTAEKYKTFVDYAMVCSYKRASIAFNPNNLHLK
jgi:hydroxyacylglutathione hydrolase